MITVRQSILWGLQGANRILLLCIIHAACAVADQPHPATRFANLTTKAGIRRGPQRET